MRVSRRWGGQSPSWSPTEVLSLSVHSVLPLTSAHVQTRSEPSSQQGSGVRGTTAPHTESRSRAVEVWGWAVQDVSGSLLMWERLPQRVTFE